MVNWLLIIAALIFAFAAAAFLAERLCRKLVEHERQRRADFAFDPLNEAKDEEDRAHN